MTNEKLLAVWKQKLPNVEPTNQELTAFAPASAAGPSDDVAMDRTRDLASSGRWPSDWVDAYRRGYADATLTPQPAPLQESSPTAGMNIAQRILHVGGRNNAAGYVEFGSIQAVEALVRQVLRDLPAPQQEAQEPVMIYHGGCTIDCGEHGHHNVELLHMIPAGSKLYTAPKPSPAAQGDAQDAARLDWLEADEMNRVFHLGKFWYTRASYGSPHRKRASLREAIDTARAAQEGK